MIKQKQSAIDNTYYKLYGNKLYHFNEKGVAISVTDFIRDEDALKEFNRVTGTHKGCNHNHWRKRTCAKIYYNQLIIQL